MKKSLLNQQDEYLIIQAKEALSGHSLEKFLSIVSLIQESSCSPIEAHTRVVSLIKAAKDELRVALTETMKTFFQEGGSGGEISLYNVTFEHFDPLLPKMQRIYLVEHQKTFRRDVSFQLEKPRRVKQMIVKSMDFERATSLTSLQFPASKQMISHYDVKGLPLTEKGVKMLTNWMKREGVDESKSIALFHLLGATVTPVPMGAQKQERRIHLEETSILLPNGQSLSFSQDVEELKEQLRLLPGVVGIGYRVNYQYYAATEDLTEKYYRLGVVFDLTPTGLRFNHACPWRQVNSRSLKEGQVFFFFDFLRSSKPQTLAFRSKLHGHYLVYPEMNVDAHRFGKQLATLQSFVSWHYIEKSVMNYFATSKAKSYRAVSLPSHTIFAGEILDL